MQGERYQNTCLPEPGGYLVRHHEDQYVGIRHRLFNIRTSNLQEECGTKIVAHDEGLVLNLALYPGPPTQISSHSFGQKKKNWREHGTMAMPAVPSLVSILLQGSLEIGLWYKNNMC